MVGASGEAMASDTSAADGSELIGSHLGSYEIVELIAHGGMGSVYKARQPALQRFVALKTLPPSVLELEDSQTHFQREAEIIARLEHPNILPIFDYGHAGAIPYLVMPLIGGGTLLDWDPGPLSSALQVVSRVLGALEYAHAHNVVHRDIKPTNIMMHHGEWPLLADFGLAQIIDPRRYVARGEYRVGTPGFMAPEQILGDPSDHRADLYAVGVILFAVLTGELPWEADDLDALMTLHLEAPIPSVRAMNPDLAPIWEEIVQRSLAKDPEARYESARAMDAAIQAACEQDQRGAQVSAQVDNIDPAELASQAALALGQSDWPRVIALCGRILESEPSHHAATYLLSQAQESMRRQRAAQLVQRGDEALAGGRLPDARRYYQVALGLVPALAAARSGLERVQRAEPQAAAAGELAAAPAGLSEEAEAWYEQGLAAAAHADWAEAIAAFRQVMALAPDFQEASLRLTEAEQALATEPAPDEALGRGGPGTAGGGDTTEQILSASAVASAAAAVGSRTRHEPGDLLLADHFGSAEFGRLPVASPAPGHYRLEYGWGQYTIGKVDPGWPGEPWVALPGEYVDATLVVDVLVRGEARERQVWLCCRSGPTPETGYQLRVAPEARQFMLLRCDGGQLATLVGWQESPALRDGERPNRLELSASGSTISASINGLRVAEVHDEAHRAGTLWLGVHTPGEASVEAVLAGFQVVQR
jgi:serine/threonine protein kinase